MQATRRLRWAVVAGAFLTLMAQILGIGLLLDRSREAALVAAHDTANRIGRAVESSINRNFVQVDAMLAGLPTVLAPYVRDGRLDAAGAARVLRELNNQNFTFRDVMIIGRDGIPLATGLGVSRGRRLPIELGPAFVETGPAAGSVAIGGPVRNPATGEWALFFARPIAMPGLGALTAVAEVPVPVIATLLSLGSEVPGLRVTLERSDGTLLASVPHDEERIGQALTPTASVLAGMDLSRSRFDDAPVVTAVRPTLYPTLVIVTAYRLETALASWITDRDRALAVAAGFALFVMALAAALLVGLHQREKVEAERQAWRTRLESALDSMSDGFVMFGPDDRLIACNQRYKDFYSISAPFIHPGAHFRDILREGALRGQYLQAGPDIEAFIDAMDYWRHSNNPPIERLLPDGRWVLITERSTPDGGTVGIRTDITQLKRAMEELAAARDAARAAGEAKTQFLARMSHELRTPLNGILGFTQVLLRDPALTPDQREQISVLQDAGRHLLELVNGLLDLSKIEAGKLDLNLRHVELRQLMDGCAGLLGPEVARKALLFSLEIAPGTPKAVEVDATRLRQMLLNLLSNAVKFTPTGGRIDLRVMPLKAGARGIRIEVEDTGPGIPAEKRHLLFEDFSQLLPNQGEETSGTGLGLAISARLAALMGGRIGCDSEHRSGALFWVELPLREVAPPALATTAGGAGAARAAGESLRVLVADDVAANRMVARAMLVAAGHRVDAASDGAEALAAAGQADYDVILMDVQMPGMDGLDATRHIRALPGRRGRVPVLAVTASALPEQIAACQAAGMDGHLSKPIDREALLAAITRLAAGQGAPPAAEAATAAEPQLVDAAALAGLGGDLGASADAVIAAFMTELRTVTVMLGAAGIADDAARLRTLAHRLLGAARTLGARRLARATETLQQELRKGGDAAPALAEVLRLAGATLPVLEAATRPELALAPPSPRLATQAAD
ncbi:ATP-binding protein [Falsiroseomonas oryziterrae]|uniref:ATP-binding protein n=1 Tax=Falsiroseomonas oryziterrae TaxID=2911368 RepID=UPI001EFF80C5|nr:ATP-binding protein [Roseomonas sp. NPKOSM-4]